MGEEIKNGKKQIYPVESMTDADYADDLALLENIPAQVEFSLHSLEQAAEGTGFHEDTNKTESICVLNEKESSPH